LASSARAGATFSSQTLRRRQFSSQLAALEAGVHQDRSQLLDDDVGWVCENHPNSPWSKTATAGCTCGTDVQWRFALLLRRHGCSA
jgi:hypothetical protein